jgi:hypothetical protein
VRLLSQKEVNRIQFSDFKVDSCFLRTTSLVHKHSQSLLNNLLHRCSIQIYLILNKSWKSLSSQSFRQSAVIFRLVEAVKVHDR